MNNFIKFTKIIEYANAVYAKYAEIRILHIIIGDQIKRYTAFNFLIYKITMQ